LTTTVAATIALSPYPTAEVAPPSAVSRQEAT
jgi:hypothetical protein